VRDDSVLGLSLAVTGGDARGTVDGVAVSWPTNRVTGLPAGVTLELRGVGSATVTVTNDVSGAVGRVRALVDAFNAVVAFVDAESRVSADAVGSLGADPTVQRLVDRVHEALSSALAGASGRWVNLSGVGITTQRDGTLALDESRLRTALTDDPGAVARLFAANGAAAASVIDDATGAHGVLAMHRTALDERIRDLQERIDAGQRAVDAFECDVRRQFAALEELVASLQSQARFLSTVSGA
jgi:flagellar hook-associated protein 2